MATVLSLADCLKAGRYTLHHALRDAGVPPFKACVVADVLFGPEPDQADDVIGEPAFP